MAAAVAKTGQSFEVIGVVVKRVIVDVMDLITLRDRAPHSLINHPM